MSPPARVAAVLLSTLAATVVGAACGLGPGDDSATQAPLTLAPSVGAEATGPTTTAPPPTPAPSSTPTPTATTPTTMPVAEADPALGDYQGNLTVRVVAQYPHDPTAFTQGLEWYGDQLIESTGLAGQSTLRLVEPTTGRVGPALRLDDELFGEGVTVVDDRAYQLTYQAGTLLVTDLAQLAAPPPDPDPDPDAGPQPQPQPMTAGTTEVRTEAYGGEGWGLCHDGTHLVMSSGSAELTFRDVRTFEVERTVSVTLNGSPVERLNELECVGGQIWANVWKSTSLLAIDPATGEVEATVDAAALVPDEVVGQNESVLNGIAYNPATRTFWLTGKYWPVLYEVELVGVDEPAEG